MPGQPELQSKTVSKDKKKPAPSCKRIKEKSHEAIMLSSMRFFRLILLPIKIVSLFFCRARDGTQDLVHGR
jgi:hypothetical protein